MGQLFQKLHALGLARCLQDLLIGSVQPSHADILQQRGVEQVLILRHIGNTAVQRLQAHVTQFLSADGDAAFLRVIVVDQQLCQSALARAGLSHQGRFLSGLGCKADVVEHFILHHHGLSVRAGLCLGVAKGNMVINDGIILAVEAVRRLLKLRRIQNLLQRRNLVVELGHGGQEAQGFEERHPDAQGEAQHQNQVRQSRPAGEDKPRPQRQGQNHSAGKEAAVNCHPGPCRLVPSQGVIPVIRNIFAKPLIGVRVLVEYLDDLHAVDVLNDGVVHLLAGHIVGAHFLHAHRVHGHHGDQADGDGGQRQQRQLPVHEKHSHIDRDGNHQVCDPLWHGVGQQDLQTVHIIDKQLFDRAGALVLDHAQRQLLKPLLQGSPQPEQRVIGGLVRKIEPPAIENSLQDQAHQHQSHPQDKKRSVKFRSHHQRSNYLVGQHKGQDAHQNADQHYRCGRVEALFMRPRVFKYLLKHDLQPPINENTVPTELSIFAA